MHFGLSFCPSRLRRPLLDAIGDSLETYLRQSGLSMYVMGLSGGIDSSFLAAVLHWRRIPYLGFCLPIATNTPAEIERGTKVALAYANPPAGVRHDPVQDFSGLYTEISRVFGEIHLTSTPLAEGNIKARIRMLFLYHTAQIHGGCVLSTDQLDELLTGFWTLHGDVGDVSPIQLIPKSAEYDLARLLCAKLADPGPLRRPSRPCPGRSGYQCFGFGPAPGGLLRRGGAPFVDYFTLKARDRSQGLLRDRAACERLEASLAGASFFGERLQAQGAGIV